MFSSLRVGVVIILDFFDRRLDLDLRRQQLVSELSPNNGKQVAKHYRSSNVQLSRQHHACCFTPSCCCRNAGAAAALIVMPGASSTVIRVMRLVAMCCQKPQCSDPRCTALRQLLQELVGGATMAESGAGAAQHGHGPHRLVMISIISIMQKH